jgi:hypothetical protein
VTATFDIQRSTFGDRRSAAIGVRLDEPSQLPPDYEKQNIADFSEER